MTSTERNVEYYESKYPNCQSLTSYLSTKSYSAAEKIVRVSDRYIPLDKAPVDHNRYFARLAERYCKITGNPYGIRENHTVEIISHQYNVSGESEFNVSEALFGEDTTHNGAILKEFLEQAEKLKIKYSEVLPEKGSDVYFHTVDKLIKKLSVLVSKENFAPEKLSSELKKILIGTVLKNMTNPRLYDIIDKYLIKCGLEKREIKVGKHIDDNDYEYLEDEPLYVQVNDPEKHNTVVAKSHDAYRFWYYDTDDRCLYLRIIPGAYEIGRRKE